MKRERFCRKSYISIFVSKLCRQLFLFLLVAYCSLLTVPAQQKIAVLSPEKTFQSAAVAQKFETLLAKNFKILDGALSEAAFRSAAYENPFNLSLAEAKNTGAAIGCDFFLLVKAENLRRSSLARPEFYESYAAVFAVSSRTGRLVFWKLLSFEDENSQNSEKKLFASTNELSAEISEKLKTAAKEETNEKPFDKLEELPEENSPEAKNFRSPLPFKRLRPEYTKTANLYRVAATVDIEVDLDAGGKILRTEIARWAGYGLDESVTETVRKMNWRAAERNGKTFPMRFLLRHNFRKIEDKE